MSNEKVKSLLIPEELHTDLKLRATALKTTIWELTIRYLKKGLEEPLPLVNVNEVKIKAR